MIPCHQCLSNLDNSNLARIRSSLELLVEVQGLDPATLEVLQDHICSQCAQA